MTGRVIDRETAGFLVLLIPLAIAAVILLTAWPYILGLIGLIMAGKLWQNYQWLKWCEKINPLFNQLVKENKGCLTPMDLSLKADLTGGTAKRFLDRKAEEYGAQRKHLEDKGTVYYFLTASALGSILDESEPLLEEETIPSISSHSVHRRQMVKNAGAEIAPYPSQLISSSSATQPNSQEPSVNDFAQLVELDRKPSGQQSLQPDSSRSTWGDHATSSDAETAKTRVAPKTALPQEPQPEFPAEENPSSGLAPQGAASTSSRLQSEAPVEEKTTSVEAPQSSLNSTSEEIDEENETALPEELQTQQQDSTNGLENASDKPKLELIQADLAKRLEINPSTVGRRKTDPDFSEWSQSKDPDGIAWKYKRKTKTFVPVEEEK